MSRVPKEKVEAVRSQTYGEFLSREGKTASEILLFKIYFPVEIIFRLGTALLKKDDDKLSLMDRYNFKFSFEVRKMKRKRFEFPTGFLVFIFNLLPPKVAYSNSDIWKPPAKATYWIYRNGQRLVIQHCERSRKVHVAKLALWLGFKTKRFEMRLYEMMAKIFEIFVKHKIHLLLNYF